MCPIHVPLTLELWFFIIREIFGYNNPRVSYNIDSTLLPTCTVERDLGVHIQDNLKVSEQCNKAANTANRILGMINRTFSYKPRVLVNTL